ncbi:DUF4829 domain-containing protein [Clostridium sp. B9]
MKTKFNKRFCLKPLLISSSKNITRNQYSIKTKHNKKIKLILSMCLILILLPLVSCEINEESKNVGIDIGQSTKFTKEEIEKAINEIIYNFDFPECTLTNVSYDEEKSNQIIESYLSNGSGKVNGAISENVIVLLSSFNVDGSGDNPVLEPNTTYTDYTWTLIRAKKSSDWKIDEQGY